VLDRAEAFAPVHPGEVLREEFLEPMRLTPYAVAKACHIPRSKLERIVREKLGISGDTAVRLGHFFGTSAQFWMNLQAAYEVQKARREIGDALAEIEPHTNGTT
jgi:addiction module HigA family antidote